MKKNVTGLILAVGVLAAFAANAVEPDAKVTLCKYCNSSAFSNAAETAAMQQAPQLREGRQFVFVVDVGTDEIRYYEVVREYVEICRQDSAAELQSGPIIDPGDAGPTLPDCFSNWVTSSTQQAPSAAAVAELRAAQEELRKFAAEVQDFDVGELGLGPIPIDSATDLFGPKVDGDNPHDPAFLRLALENAVANQYFDTWIERRIADIGDLAARFANIFITEPAVTTINATTVHFEDGTTITLIVTTIVRDDFGNFKTVKVEVDLESAQGQNLSSIPTDPGNFVSTFQDGFAGDALFIGNLSDLFVRGGGRVNRGPPSASCVATIMCWVEDGVKVCQTSFPDPQLSGC